MSCPSHVLQGTGCWLATINVLVQCGRVQATWCTRHTTKFFNFLPPSSWLGLLELLNCRLKKSGTTQFPFPTYTFFQITVLSKSPSARALYHFPMSCFHLLLLQGGLLETIVLAFLGARMSMPVLTIISSIVLTSTSSRHVRIAMRLEVHMSLPRLNSNLCIGLLGSFHRLQVRQSKTKALNRWITIVVQNNCKNRIQHVSTANWDIH